MTPLERLVAQAHCQEMGYRSDQESVTNSLLLPSMPHLTGSLALLRKECDSWIRTQGNRVGLPIGTDGDSRLADYPVGFCAVIRDRVYEGMLRLPQIQQLTRSGVMMKKIFVILKGLYFQNAIQLGNLYIDVANDTVDPSKPWLEWMEVRKVDFANIGDLTTLIRVAETYHRCRVYPNLFFPLLAPVVPLLAIRENGRLDLLHFQDGGFLKDISNGFPNLRAWLAGPARSMAVLPDPYACALAGAVGSNQFASFPFEFRPCSLDEITAQVDSYSAAFAETSGHETILSVLKLVPQALRQLAQRNLMIGS